METCKTPSNTEVIEFKFDHVSTPIITAEYIQKMQNLVVNCGNRRCFTPMASDICSPGLSPIAILQTSAGEATDATDSNHFNFPVPIASTKQYKKISPTTRLQKTPNNQEQPQQQQQEQHEQLKQQMIENQIFYENLSFELDLSASTKLESSLDGSTSRSETSKTSNILNHTLSVTLLLNELGLSKHSEKFAREGIDLEKFLKIKPNELKGLGLESDEDCKAIIDMVGELNSAQNIKV